MCYRIFVGDLDFGVHAQKMQVYISATVLLFMIFFLAFMTRIMRAFELPVYYKQIPPAKKYTLDMTSMVKWIVSVMNGHPALLDQLEQMFNALESFYHSANYGAHSLKLSDFLLKLVHHFVAKIYRERYVCIDSYYLIWKFDYMNNTVIHQIYQILCEMKT